MPSFLYFSQCRTENRFPSPIGVEDVLFLTLLYLSLPARSRPSAALNSAPKIMISAIR
jgi:hypothetical protein